MPTQSLLIGCAVLLLTSCVDLTAARDPLFKNVEVDRPGDPILHPTSVKVGEETYAFLLPCSPELSMCVAKVRDLRWAVRPESVAVITRPDPGQAVWVRGVSPGGAWVVATGRGGSDSTLLRVTP